MLHAWLALLVAFVITALLTWPVRRLALRLGAVAYPGGRHIHQEVMPTAGGLAIFAGVWASFLLMGGLDERPVFGMLSGSLILLGVCLVDDIKNLSPYLRLVAQFFVAALAYYAGVRIEGITNPFSPLGMYEYVPLSWAAAPITILWIMAITNALNWLDGLDGLVAGVGALAGLTIMLGAQFLGDGVVAILAGAVAGSCLGFLPYNFNPARIFMGDTGAMFLGYMLACIAVIGPFKSTTAVAVLVPLLVLGVPIYDTTTAIMRRLREGRSPLSPDRGHIHHRLLDRGLSVRQAVLFIYGLTAVLCALALLLWRWRYGE